MPVKGIERVRRNYKKTVKRLSGPVSYGAVYAVLSQGATYSNLMVPVDTSTLINSQYNPVVQVAETKVSGHIGYQAAYAYNVHEASGVLRGMPRANGNGSYWDPDGNPQFLYKGFEQLKPFIPAILKRNYRV